MLKGDVRGWRRQRFDVPGLHVPSPGLTRELADPGNSGWKVQLGRTGASDTASSSTDDLEQKMNFQGVVINVADLNRSIDFYREVLDFRVRSQKEQLAVVSAPGSDLPQVIVLRAFGRSPLGGARHIGLRSFVLEVESTDQLERIASEMDSRRLLVNRRDHSEWTAVVGRDPDGVAIVVASSSGAGRITENSWSTLDDFLYGIGE